MDSSLANIGLVGLVALGVVNVVSLFKPDLDSRIKFMLSFLVAFGVTFIPEELGSLILQNAKVALQAAFSASAAYKLFSKAGGLPSTTTTVTTPVGPDTTISTSSTLPEK